VEDPAPAGCCSEVELLDPFEQLESVEAESVSVGELGTMAPPSWLFSVAVRRESLDVAAPLALGLTLLDVASQTLGCCSAM